MHQRWLEKLFELRMIQWLAATVFLARGLLRWTAGRRYRALEDFCWILRVSANSPIHRIPEHFVSGVLRMTRQTGTNPVVKYYRKDPSSRHCAEQYTIAGGGNDLWRDLIVLKSGQGGEKGVILLKYGRTFSAVTALFDLGRLMERYVFVLEPSWAGYCDPAILAYFAPGHPVAVQCFTRQDFEFIERVGDPFVPVRLGPADWVDTDVFAERADVTKTYDLVMVANWSANKRHSLLFRALRALGDRSLRVLLVGFPWGGRTAEDVRREARRHLPPNVEMEILESVPHTKLATLLHQCKVFLFLSRKEGDNKALVEAMFANVPSIVFEASVGGATSRINSSTGVLSSERDLPTKIAFMLEHHSDFAPRRWALGHTGSSVATKTLDGILRRTVRATGGQYSTEIVEKVNGPNLMYRHPRDREQFLADYDYILSCRRVSGSD